MTKTMSRTEKPDKGTHFEPSKTEQRSYFLPVGLGDAFKDFNLGNASTGIRGAMIIYMALDDFSSLREAASRAAMNLEISAAVEKIKSSLIEEVGLRALHEWAKSLPEGERAKILAEARRRK
jgi:hypothetical protein